MTTMNKITPHLWFDTQAQEAADLYTRAFQGGRILSRNVMEDTPSGTVTTLTIALADQQFILLNAGPLFKFTPAISFQVSCPTRAETDTLWLKLVEGGEVLMPLDEYDFSARFGWLQDRFGVSWQISWVAETPEQRIAPTLMFVGAQAGKCEEALKHYVSIFKDARLGDVLRYGADESPDVEGTIKYADVTLEGQAFAAMDSAHPHQFTFNEAISLMVRCEDQAEIDHYWNALSADPSAEQCGWLKDKYGVSWQVVPRAMDAMMETGTQEQIARVTQAFLPMKKFELAALQRAYDGA